MTNTRNANTKAPEPPRSYSASDWERDFNSAFEMQKVVEGQDGTKEFSACFKSPDDICEFKFDGYHDGFGKVYFLSAPRTRVRGLVYKMLRKAETNPQSAYIALIVGARQCNPPQLILKSEVHQKQIFGYKRLSFMADGEVVFEKNALREDVQHEFDHGIAERWSYLFNEADFVNIGKFASARSKIVRITGKSGFITVAPEAVEAFVKDFKEASLALQRIQRTFIKSGGPVCK